MDGIASPEQIAERVAQFGQSSFALTDHGTMSGCIDGYKAAKKFGLKFIFGCEMYWVANVHDKTTRDNWHIVFYAKDLEGYRNLCAMVTESYQNMYYKPRIDTNIIRKYHKGLICTSACMGGIASHPVDENMLEILDIFKGDFYLEHHMNTMPEQITFNKMLDEYRDNMGLKIIPAVDAHYINKEDAPTHRKWKLLSEDSTYYPVDDFYLRDTVDYDCTYIQEIIDKCNVEIPMGVNHYPKYQSPDTMAEFRRITYAKWKELGIDKYPNQQVYIDRMKHEVDILTKAGYIDYMMIVHDIIKHAESKEIPIGPGRGSCVGSLASYLLDITKLDPVKLGLTFERFVHLERLAPPDIDTDFSQKRREEVINYVKAKYGHVVHFRVFGYMGKKASLKRAGKALGWPVAEVNAISKKIETFKPQTNKEKELIDLANKFEGIIQNNSTHASAVIVFPSDPSEWCPIESNDHTPVVAYDFEYLEEMGLLKLDILGLATLDVIADTEKMIGNHCYEEDDYPTFEMLRKGDTKGIFQIEGESVSPYCYRLQPHRFEDLIPVVAIARPGPIDSGMAEMFVKRHLGKEPVTYAHPKLEPILKETNGIIVYQEQIMAICQALCGYSLGEGDVLRRIIGKKKPEQMGAAIDKFIERGIMNGVDAITIRDIADQIVTFADYGFNKSHAAAYGYIAFQEAYLKANYPLQFYCALLNSKIGDIDATSDYVSSARLHGIQIVPPDLKTGQMKWSVQDGKLMVGFMAIKGIGGSTELSDIRNAANQKINARVYKALEACGCFGPVEAGSEKNFLGFDYAEILDRYDLSICDIRGDIIGGEVLDTKRYQCKNGKWMYFIKLRERNGAKDYSMFKDEELIKGRVYLVKVHGDVINQYMEADKL